MKGAIFKDYWELASGASYIPWDKIPSEKELEKLSDGGWIVPETCPPGMKPPEIKREQSLSFQYQCTILFLKYCVKLMIIKCGILLIWSVC